MASYAKFDKWLDSNHIVQQAVLQVKTYTYTSTYSTTTHGGAGLPSSVGTDTPLAVSITPRSTSSKVLVFVNGTPQCSQNLTIWNGVIKRHINGQGDVFSTGTAITGGGDTYWTMNYLMNQVDNMNNFAFNWLDTPNTTSAITYTLRITGNAAGYAVGIGTCGNSFSTWGGINTITAMEIDG